jgi:tRNA dimethylallyltransferase
MSISVETTTNPLSTKTLIVLLGPTGVGKTSISLGLAEMFGCPIVSSDSRQFYRELKIGTAAPTALQLARVPHYFIGSHSIFDDYNAGQYELDAVAKIEELFLQHNVVLLVGGSMMYIDAVCNGMDDIPSVDTKTRTFWQNEYAEKGLEFIQNELKKIDPQHYEEVDCQNPKRIIHALEISDFTGKPYSSFRTGQKKKRSFEILKIGLNRPRPELYERINRRVELMMAEGLLAEAEQFLQFKHLNTLNTVGYKELYEYFLGNWTLEFAVNMIKQDTRRYAKRQLTWFNRDKEIHWFQAQDKAVVLSFVKEKLA